MFYDLYQEDAVRETEAFLLLKRTQATLLSEALLCPNSSKLTKRMINVVALKHINKAATANELFINGKKDSKY